MINNYSGHDSYNCRNCSRKITFTSAQIVREAILTCTCGHKIHLSDYKEILKKGIEDTKDIMKELNMLQRANRKNSY